MNNKRQKVRKHITAAKDWLGRAENSMDKENDVRSDLDMMLAQAELQRAHETKFSQGWRKWLIRLAPLFIAVLVGVGYVVFLQQEREGAVPPPIDNVQPNQPEIVNTPVGEVTKVQEPELPAAVETEKNRPLPEPAYNAAKARETAEKAEGDAGGEPTRQDSLPEPEMQKLMQSAGKVLRE